jgi:hypothetical protein
LGNALSSGELDLDERKRRKAEDVIEAVGGNELERLRSEYLALQANTQESLRQLKSKGLLEKREGLEQELLHNHFQAELIRAKQRELQRRSEEITKSISKFKTSIETHVARIARQTVLIIAQ